jgi:glyoxylase-like metal-dependent hydrolase (beta-lactamase superfamily II)
VLYTPAHASDHGSFLDRSSGIAFVRDAAGIRITGSYVRGGMRNSSVASCSGT